MVRPGATGRMSCAGPVDVPLLVRSVLAGRVGGRRQREAEARAAEGRLVVRPDLSAMRFDDGAGDGKSHAHAAIIGREKTLKELREMIRLDARTAVFQRAAQGILASKH